jgi:hypothetical protein
MPVPVCVIDENSTAIVRHARLVVDTRNATHGVGEYREKVVRC